MTAISTTARRVLIGVAFTAGIGLGMAAYDAATHSAHAADKLPVVEQAGGVLDHGKRLADKPIRLPEQASQRAKEIHGLPAGEPECEEPADKPAESKPADDTPTPKPEPSDAPAAKPTEEPAPNPVVVKLPTEPIVKVPPPEVDPTPAPATDVDLIVIPPTTDQTPPPIDVPLPAIPAAPLPVPVALIPAAKPTPPAAPVLAADSALALLRADCDEQAAHVDRDAIRQLLTTLTDPPRQQKADTAPGCPGKPSNPHNPHLDCTPGVTPSSGSSIHATADSPDHATTPGLSRLTHVRARSHLPTSRHVAIEPGPA